MGDQIRIQDKTTQSGDHRFKIEAIADDNGISPVGSTLGILGIVNPVSDNPNTPQNESNNGDILLGTSLFRAPITDQFYVTLPNSKVFANVSIDSPDIDLMTAIGIFDVGVANGSLNFNANASLAFENDIDDPETTLIDESTDGKIRLKDFAIGGLGANLDPQLTYSGSLNLPFDGTVLSTLLPPEYLPLSVSATLMNESPTSITPKLDFNTSTLEAALGSFKNFNITDLIRVIQQVVQLLENSDLKGLNKPIPIINKTPNDILEIVDGLADAAQDLLEGFDKEELLAKILELEAVQTQLNSIPEIVNKIQEQITKIKLVADASHLFQVSVPGLTQIASGLDLSIDSTPTEVFNELTRIYGPGVIESVTGKIGEEYRVTFNQAVNVANKFQGKSPTGLAIQARTEIEGIVGSVSEVQLLSFVKTGPIVAAIADLRKIIDTIPNSAQGRIALLDKFNNVAASVVSRLNLGQIVGDAIKDRLNLPPNAFDLSITYVDADSFATGFQGAAIVELDIDKTVTKTFGFDFNLPELGPVNVSTGGNLDVTVGGQLNLDFGFRLDNFTPYLLDSTNISLDASIDSISALRLASPELVAI